MLGGLALAAGCDAILGIDDGAPRDGASEATTGDAADDAPLGDAGPDASGPPTCDVDAAFGTPVAIMALDTTANDAHPRLTQDELVAYFQSNRDGGAGLLDIYSATRSGLDAGWTKVTNIGTVNSTSSEYEPSISNDQLRLYLVYASDVYEATRGATTAPFSAPTAVTPLDTTASESGPYLLPNGNVYFTSTRASDAGVFALYVATPGSDGGFGAPTAVSGADFATGEIRFGAVTPDELVLYFASTRTGNLGGRDIYVATRATPTDAFGPARQVAEVSSASNEYPDWISPDRCRLYFTSNRGDAGDDNIYVAEKALP